MDYTQKMKRYHEYIEALQQEQKKIQVFQRELPLCLQLVTGAIESCRKELSRMSPSEHVNGISECSERTTSDSGGFQEFIPIKCSSSSSDEDNKDEAEDNKMNSQDKKKSDWLKSVQLWNQSPDLHPNEREKPVMSSSTVEVKQYQCRKQRRCWSPELHRRFVQALKQLGGSDLATPKLIRDLMKVDGLSNDEVKSHLQKFRLHSKRFPTPAIKTANKSNNNRS